MRNEISLSICVPALNEEKTLADCVQDLLTTLTPLVKRIEIIIVNDGSSDDTAHLAEQLAGKYNQVKVIHHKKNLGVGRCYQNALKIAEGDYFTWFPSDHENSARDFIQCLPYLGEKKVVTCHHLGHDPRSFLRRFISRSYTWIINRYFHLDLKFYNGQAIFPLKLINSLPLIANGFIFFAESIIRSAQNGYRVVELPAPMKIRVGRKSNSLTIKSFRQLLIDLFKIIFSKKCR